MAKPLLVVFLGFPGSGKTYFSRRLAKRLQAVTLNTDALRLSMFGSLERISELRQSDNARLYVDVFGAMDYAAKQTLLAGHSVVYDAQQTKRENRRNIEKIAEESGAIPVLVWVRTSRETAIRRGQERVPGDDSLRYDAEKIAYLIDKFDSMTELPEPGENMIEISGELSFEEQYRIFTQGVEAFEYE